MRRQPPARSRDYAYTYIYQKDNNNRYVYRRAEVLEYTVYRDGRAPSFNTRNDRDYLLAREIENNKKYTLKSDEISSCYTSSTKVYENTETGEIFNLISVAGHGHWAYKVRE